VVSLCDPENPVLELCKPRRTAKELEKYPQINLIRVHITCNFKGIPKSLIGRFKVLVNFVELSLWEGNGW
jgi:hypothetical protein